MIPPRPWMVSAPPYEPGWAYILDAAGGGIGGAYREEIARFIVEAVNAHVDDESRTRPPLGFWRRMKWIVSP